MDKKINKLIKVINNCAENNHVLLLGLSYCPYTSKSKNYLKSNNIKYIYYTVDKYYDIFIDLLNQLNNKDSSFEININHKTFPIIFYNNKFIGGYSELIKYDELLHNLS
jgi:glutaredoxin